LDVSERILWRAGERVPLSEKAFETLCALVRRGNHLVSKDELLNEVWADAIVEENNLDKNISLLRRVLGERAGKVTEARAVLDELLKLSTTRYVPPYNFALVYNALNEQEKALDCLEQGYAQKDVRMVFLKVEPKWNNLRSEARFIELMKRMRLE
jgi:hypothetical protein